MRSTLFLASVLLASSLTAPFVYSGDYSQDFSAFSAGTTNLGDGTTIASNDGVASVQGSGVRYLRMTQNNTGSTASSFKLPDLDPGQELESFTARFLLQIGGTGSFA
ncbi:MAG: hypothetical protein ACR2RV_08080, partial [Verrucomicrobiales bacterium]